eukprot:365196-Chlamydomonas_euryale.AAC.3
MVPRREWQACLSVEYDVIVRRTNGEPWGGSKGSKGSDTRRNRFDAGLIRGSLCRTIPALWTYPDTCFLNLSNTCSLNLPDTSSSNLRDTCSLDLPGNVLLEPI